MCTATGIVVFTGRNCTLVRSNYVCIQENALLQRLHFTHSAGDEFTCYSVRRGRSDTVVISMSETTAELVFHWTGHGTHSQLEIKYYVLGFNLCCN